LNSAGLALISIFSRMPGARKRQRQRITPEKPSPDRLHE
jgi:hypothetical protein